MNMGVGSFPLSGAKRSVFTVSDFYYYVLLLVCGWEKDNRAPYLQTNSLIEALEAVGCTEVRLILNLCYSAPRFWVILHHLTTSRYPQGHRRPHCVSRLPLSLGFALIHS